MIACEQNVSTQWPILGDPAKDVEWISMARGARTSTVSIPRILLDINIAVAIQEAASKQWDDWPFPKLRSNGSFEPSDFSCRAKVCRAEMIWAS